MFQWIFVVTYLIWSIKYWMSCNIKSRRQNLHKYIIHGYCHRFFWQLFCVYSTCLSYQLFSWDKTAASLWHFPAQINNPCLSPHFVLTYNPGYCWWSEMLLIVYKFLTCSAKVAVKLVNRLVISFPGGAYYLQALCLLAALRVRPAFGQLTAVKFFHRNLTGFWVQ